MDEIHLAAPHDVVEIRDREPDQRREVPRRGRGRPGCNEAQRCDAPVAIDGKARERQWLENLRLRTMPL